MNLIKRLFFGVFCLKQENERETITTATARPFMLVLFGVGVLMCFVFCCCVLN
jgi:hypothetical protein